MLWQKLSEITLVEWVIFGWAITQLVFKAGEWKRTQDRPEASVPEKRPDDTASGQPVLITRDQLNLELEKHATECRHDARNIVNELMGRHTTDLNSTMKEVRQLRDWLIEVQANLNLKRKDRT